jgi:serine-type D-Ala-D-Ala carboxypeptidase/endopeptidase (penicillin-binding protein 4)
MSGRGIRLAALTLAFVPAMHGASLAQRIDGALAGDTAFWGIQVVDVASGRTLYEHNAKHFFVPASNTKLFTTAMALTRLGPDFTFQTRVLADALPDGQGRVRGPLRLMGGGDPNLSARAIPYRTGPISGNPLAAIDDLADQIAARGVKRVEGGIIGDDTWYLWEPYGSGWGIDDPESDDGTAVSALTTNDNALTLTIHPAARAGDLASLSFNPPLEYYQIDNRVVTVGQSVSAAEPGAAHIRFSRLPGSRNARLWGTIGPGSLEVRVLGIEDPALYAAMALKNALEDRGITVEGAAEARHEYPNQVADPAQRAERPEPPEGLELARRVSAPLIEDLRITDKVSENLHAELALRAVGRERRNIGSVEAGLDELKMFLGEAGIAPESYNIRDGSGLARLNLVSPSAVVRLLQYMHASPHGKEWVELLPVGGRDGTLEHRFANTPAAGRVHAKTGSLSHVSALSGYIQRKDEKWLVFSIIVNNYNASTAAVRGTMDRICNVIVE